MRRAISITGKTERDREEWEVEHLPKEEKKEIRKLYQSKGFEGEVLEKVVSTITANKKLWVDEMMIGEHDLLSENSDIKPWKNAATTFVAFVIAGFVPLIPYLFGLTSGQAFPYAIVATVIILFTVGSLRTLITGKRWFSAGLEMLTVGILAAGFAYLVGLFLSRIV